ncbi:hypothetical protein [Paenibacillus agri]|uniref:hypothetical protein n=1 Tax=Paenibacillus agri TaxID=2744309 RepID=UPI001FE55662|nr:hypothetical protein [Paenibacillus agri]
MDKGYIHTDSALWDEGKSAESWTKGAAGILPGANWVPDWPAPDLLKNVPADLYMKTLVKLADGKTPETPYEKQMAEFRKPENWAAAKVVMS